MATKLLHEACDHWENSEVYRHFLPRILSVMAPPESKEDLFPLHIFETLHYHQFHDWPVEEKEAVVSFLTALIGTQELFDTQDRADWEKGILSLQEPSKKLQVTAYGGS